MGAALARIAFAAGRCASGQVIGTRHLFSLYEPARVRPNFKSSGAIPLMNL
jgi:hypothetical protein